MKTYSWDDATAQLVQSLFLAIEIEVANADSATCVTFVFQ